MKARPIFFLILMIPFLVKSQVGVLKGWGMSICNTYSFSICPNQTIVPLNYGTQGWACNSFNPAPDISFINMGSTWRIARQNYSFTATSDGQFNGFNEFGVPQTLTVAAGQTVTPSSYALLNGVNCVIFAINGNTTSTVFNQSNFSISIVPTPISPNTFTICPSQNPTVSISPVLPQQGGPWTFIWQPGNLSGNPVTVSPTVSTIYTVSATAGASCVSTATIAVNTMSGCCTNTLGDPSSVTGNTSVCMNSSNNYSISPVNGATSYSWSLPGGWTGTSSTNTISTVAAGGSGTLGVWAVNQCTSTSLVSLSVTVIDCNPPTGLAEAAGSLRAHISPNPFHGSFTITKNSALEMNVTILEISGREVFNTILGSELENRVKTDLAPGIYLLKCKVKGEKDLFFRVIAE